MSDAAAPTRYAFLDFNAPLSDGRAAAIVRALAESEPETVVDLGCGWGELLLRLLAVCPSARGLGVDSDPALVARGRSNAAARGLAGRTVFVEGDATADREPADVVICVGVDHAWGSQADALAELHGLVRPGGRLLFGGGFWERRPSLEEADALGLTPGSLPDLAGLVDLTLAAGFRPLFVQTANRDEWERFESGFLADLEEWLQRNAGQSDAADVRVKADEHRNRWLRGYRHVLGFAYLTLGRPER